MPAVMPVAMPVTMLAAYAAPAMVLAALYLPLFTYVTPFYAEEQGVALGVLGLAWICIRLFDAVSDPVIGWLSDRTPGRFGRRRLWLAASVPLIAVSTWMAFVPPADAGLWHAVLWLFLLTLGWSMAQTPYAAWGAEIAPDYSSRLRVTAWREALVLVGTVLSTILYVVGGEGGEGLRTVALGVIVGLPLLMLLALWRVPDPPRPASAASPPGLTFRAGLATLADNRPFRRLLAAWFVNGAANGLPASLFLFFVADRLEAPEAQGMLFLLYFLSAVLGIPFWNWAAGRGVGAWAKHRVWGAAMVYACAIFAAALLLGPGDIVPFAIITVLTGLAFGADLTLPPAIQADVVAADTAETGAERAGLFFALWQVATKAALALSSGLAYIALDFAGFTAGGENSEGALLALALLYAGAPIVLKLIAVWLMWGFELDRERLATLGAA
ncbi:MAG: MFS transporter [Pseudomonadota bacterium]